MLISLLRLLYIRLGYVSPIVNLNSRPLSTRSTRGQPAPIFAYDTLGGANTQGLVSTLSTNFTMPVVPKGAYISTPVYSILDNSCILPPCTGYVVGSSSLFPVVKHRHRSYSAMKPKPKSVFQALQASVNSDLSWFAPSFVPPTPVFPLQNYPLHEPGFERSHNMYNLAPDVLNNVAFLADLPLADIPAGLHLPSVAIHEIPYGRAIKDPKKYPPAQLKASLDKEISKMVDRFGALEIVTAKSQISDDAIYVSALLLSKVKYLADGAVDRITTRFALNGTMQKDGDFGET